MGGAVIGVKCARTEICGSDPAAGDVSFPDPGALGMRKNDRYGYAGEGELVNKGVDIRGGELRGGAVVVYHLEVRTSLV